MTEQLVQPIVPAIAIDIPGSRGMNHTDYTDYMLTVNPKAAITAASTNIENADPIPAASHNQLPTSISNPPIPATVPRPCSAHIAATSKFAHAAQQPTCIAAALKSASAAVQQLMQFAPQQQMPQLASQQRMPQLATTSEQPASDQLMRLFTDQQPMQLPASRSQQLTQRTLPQHCMQLASMQPMQRASMQAALSPQHMTKISIDTLSCSLQCSSSLSGGAVNAYSHHCSSSGGAAYNTTVILEEALSRPAILIAAILSAILQP